MPSNNEGRHSSPTLLRRRVGSELRRLREAAGLTTDQVAAHLYCSPSKISRVETARVTAMFRDVRDMLELYRVSGQQREDLLQLAREAGQKDAWWHSCRDVPDVRTYMSFEKAAEAICIWESLIIPGLLQIEEYARLITRIIFPDLGEREVERHIELRMTRQALLVGDHTPVVRVVLDEAALQRLVGMPTVIRDQLHHLVGAARMPNVSLRILPFRAGAHGGMIGPFTILGFPDSADPDVVHLESPTGDLYLDSADQVHRYRILFEQLQAGTFTPNESISFLVKLANEL